MPNKVILSLRDHDLNIRNPVLGDLSFSLDNLCGYHPITNYEFLEVPHDEAIIGSVVQIHR